MFNKPFPSADSAVAVQLSVADVAVGRRLTKAFEQMGRFHLASRTDLEARAGNRDARVPSTLQIFELREHDPQSWTDLERSVRELAPRSTIVLADEVTDQAARRLLKLQIADLLPLSCSERDLLAACEQALKTDASLSAKPAHCTVFVSAVGGAGASTLSLATASMLSRARSGAPQTTCVVDLDLQSGSLADYLDLTPNLQLSEVTKSPERLDLHLLQVMLSRHKSGLALLAAPSSLNGAQNMSADIAGRFLDLAASQFDAVVVDLPRASISQYRNVLQGADAIYIVTELSVSALRQARRLAEGLESAYGINTERSVVVNKVHMFGNAGVGKKEATDVLGKNLSGFVGHCGPAPVQAQNRGVPLSDIKKRNRLEKDLKRVIDTLRA